MKALLILAALSVVGILWALNHLTATELQAELQGLQRENSNLPAARREQERLRQVHAEAMQRAAEPREAAPSVQPTPESTTSLVSTLVVGEWRAPSSWQKRGQSTAVSAMETALWAAAGGDLAALQSLLLLDETVRVKAGALWAQLPEAARANYTSAEQLLAACATKFLPLGDAQLVWNHQPNADEAFACLFVKNPEFVPVALPVSAPMATSREAAIAQAVATREARAKEKRPPMAPPNEAIRALYLALRRTEAGWHLAVSPAAVERIEQELRAGK
jgi:hypothetical protein